MRLQGGLGHLDSGEQGDYRGADGKSVIRHTFEEEKGSALGAKAEKRMMIIEEL